MKKNDDMVMCPMVDNNIEIGDCVVYSDIASGMFKEECIPDEFRKKEDWRKVCEQCIYHNI